MLAVLIFLLVISAFSFFAAFKLGRTFESTIPISTMGIVLFLFLCGMINVLKVGWILVIVAALALYIYTLYWIVKNGAVATIKANVYNLITPGSVIFMILALLIAYFNQDRLAIHTDEFSHWLDTVIIMTRIDAFGTAPGSTAIFPSYPPAMSLFQYLLEKINMALTGDFSEWKVYYAYQLMAISVMIYFAQMKGATILKKLAGIISWPICLIVPLFFFTEVYSSLYIDPFLGVLGGCGFAAISITKNKDWVYNAYVTMLCAVLVLAKDVGIYLALFVSLYYLIDYVVRTVSYKNVETKQPNQMIKTAAVALLPILSMLAAKMLWKIELAVSHTVQKFSQPFDISGTIATIKGNGNEFYTAVLENFKAAITYRYIYYERMGFNYTAIMSLLVVSLICLHVSIYRRGTLKKSVAIAGTVIPGVAIIAYILSMFPLYISRFVEEEALNLASFDRYCGIMFLTGVLLTFWLLRDMLLDSKGEALALCLAALMLLSVNHSQKDNINYYTSRRSVEDSIAYRQAVNILALEINEACAEDARILVVGENSDYIYTAMLSTLCKPRIFEDSVAYFSEIPDEDGSVGITAQEFSEILEDNFDYVAIYKATEAITGPLKDAFENSDGLHELALYSVKDKVFIY